MKSQKKSALIEVPWVVDELDIVDSYGHHLGEINSTTVISSFSQTFWGQSWVEFLFDHATKIETDSYYDPATMLYNITIMFHLPPEEETMYRLRFD